MVLSPKIKSKFSMGLMSIMTGVKNSTFIKFAGGCGMESGAPSPPRFNFMLSAAGLKSIPPGALAFGVKRLAVRFLFALRSPSVPSEVEGLSAESSIAASNIFGSTPNPPVKIKDVS